MFCVAMRFVKDTQEAEDIVQEAFIKAFRKLEQYKADVTFGAWLKRIVINNAIDCLKAKKARMLELEETHLKVVDSDSEQDWLVDDSLNVDDIKRAIEQLSEKYRYVVMLYLIEGYDHQEISEILGISEVASRTHLHRGKKKLQELLKQEHNGTGY